MLRLYFAIQGVQLEYLTAAEAQVAEKSMREEWQQYGEGCTFKEYMRVNLTHNLPRAGYAWVVEVSSEDVAGGYGYATAEEAAWVAARKHGTYAAKYKPEEVCTAELLSYGTWCYQHWVEAMGTLKNRKAYEQAWYQWVAAAQSVNGLATLEKMWGFKPMLPKEKARAILQQAEIQLLREQARHLQQKVENLTPIEAMRATLGNVKGLTCDENGKWLYEHFTYEDERRALWHLLLLKGKRDKLVPYEFGLGNFFMLAKNYPKYLVK